MIKKLQEQLDKIREEEAATPRSALVTQCKLYAHAIMAIISRLFVVQFCFPLDVRSGSRFGNFVALKKENELLTKKVSLIVSCHG